MVFMGGKATAASEGTVRLMGDNDQGYDFQEAWKAVTGDDNTNGATITLNADWWATENYDFKETNVEDGEDGYVDITYSTSFGEGDGFENGCSLVPADKTVTIDLNGKDIDRLLDYTDLDPVEDGGKLILNGGSVEWNDTTAQGGGVYIAEGGEIEVSGKAEVFDNTRSYSDSLEPNNIYLTTGTTIAIAENVQAFTGDGKLGVTTQRRASKSYPVTITKGANNTSLAFFAADSEYAKQYGSATGEIIFVGVDIVEDDPVVTTPSYTLSFNSNGGSSISPVTAARGYEVSLDAYVPTLEGCVFGGWYSDSSLTAPITALRLTSDMTVYAKWTEQQPETKPEVPETKVGYTDVSTADWYCAAATYCNEKGIMTGTADRIFDGAALYTRASEWQSIYNMNKGAVVHAAADGISLLSWYDEAMQWAMGVGITDGADPNGSVTREQMAVMLYRYTQYLGLDVKSDGAMGMAGYEDVDSISDWAYDPMQWAVLNGIIEGSSGLLNPQGSATRAEVAQMFMNYAEHFAAEK